LGANSDLSDGQDAMVRTVQSSENLKISDSDPLSGHNAANPTPIPPPPGAFGVCSACRAKLVAGTAEITTNYSLEKWELEAGFILTCQAHPTSAEVVIDYDAV
jgi:hypothetical protein